MNQAKFRKFFHLNCIFLVAEVDELTFNGFDYKIPLQRNSMTSFVPANEPEEPNAWPKIRWNVTAPHGSRITIACHFTDKPPEPLTLQVSVTISKIVIFFLIVVGRWYPAGENLRFWRDMQPSGTTAPKEHFHILLTMVGCCSITRTL